MNTDKYTVELEYFHFSADNFKQKDAMILINSLRQGRLNSFMAFDSFGSMTFNDWDTALQYPTFEYLDDFNRNKTNCIIFNNLYCTDKYDKIFIYWSNNPHTPYYNYVFYNTHTGDLIHRICIDFANDELSIALTKTFYLLPKIDTFNKGLKDFENSKCDVKHRLITNPPQWKQFEDFKRKQQKAHNLNIL